MLLRIRSAPMRNRLRRLAPICVLGLLSACDTWYQVGARQYLRPVARVSDSARGEESQSRGAPPVDISRTADCLETAANRASGASLVKRGHASDHYAEYMTVAISDSALVPEFSRAILEIRAWPKEQPAVQLLFRWPGNARRYPLPLQRRLISAATKLLDQLRVACLPTATDGIQCVAEGLGGHKACETTP
jgi:hypothetical protein